MKKPALFVVFLFFYSLHVSSQSPLAFKYQTIVRDTAGNIISNQNISIAAAILKGNASGTFVFAESHNVTSNKFGLINLEIGNGTPIGVWGELADISWAEDEYFLWIGIDLAGGTSYEPVGISQLISVPYALHARTADSVEEVDPIFNISIASGITSDDTLNWNNLSLSDVLMNNNNGAGYQMKNIADPTENQDVATKAYVDEMLEIIVNSGLITRDIDGNFYSMVKIGNQIWMAENLRTTKFNDGTPIPKVTDNTTWGNLTTPAYCWLSNDIYFYNIYGCLYNWYTVATGNLCPVGWHVPTDSEWTELTNFLGGEWVAGGKLKETGTEHWYDPNVGATNETGFTALPGGYRVYSGNFFGDEGFGGYWWTSSIYINSIWYRSMSNTNDDVYRHFVFKESGYSVRCIRD